MEYVLTFPVAYEPVQYVSVLVCGFSELLQAMNMGLQSDPKVSAIRHGETARRDSDECRSPLSEHPLIIGSELQDDLVDDGEGGQVVSSVHKFGGRSHCIHEPELEGAEALLDDGFMQVLQLDFPGYEDGDISGDWPFADGLFNLYMKPEGVGPVYWAFQK